eukprot:comp6395_c0_seq1/m.2196 comp6395_c0_seq1/g.2196  ORF comp6395_c0_seq1/g.2196 comp6395_c0_seq1/m.2196 type:complete len:419 (-) comp6395_c0_seq1:387-1643(-)
MFCTVRSKMEFPVERARELLSSSQSGVCIKNADGIYIFANRHFETMFGDVVGKTDYQAFAPSLASQMCEQDSRARANRTPCESDLRVSAEDGIHSLLVLRVPLNNDLLAVILTDTTEFQRTVHRRKTIQSAITRAFDANVALQKYWHARYTSTNLTQAEQEELNGICQTKMEAMHVIRNSPAMIYVKDDRGRYIVVNKRFEDLFGRKNAVVVGRTDDELFADPSQPGGLNAHGRWLVRNDGVVAAEKISLEVLDEISFPYVQTDGEQQRVDTYLTLKFPLLNAEGTVLCMCGISVNLTSFKTAYVAERAYILSVLRDCAKSLETARTSPTGRPRFFRPFEDLVDEPPREHKPRVVAEQYFPVGSQSMDEYPDYPAKIQQGGYRTSWDSTSAYAGGIDVGRVRMDVKSEGMVQPVLSDR